MKKAQSMAEGLKDYMAPFSKIFTEIEKLEPFLDAPLSKDLTAAKYLLKD